MATALKGFIDERGLRGAWGSVSPSREYPYRPANPQFLFDTISWRIPELINRDDLYIAPLTGADGPNPADCVFLCVNPASDNLEKSLEYISYLSQHLMDQQDTGMLSDLTKYTKSDYAQRLYDLYANATIDFNLSDEVFADVFDRYLNDEISLDELIREADRKLAMYRGE